MEYVKPRREKGSLDLFLILLFDSPLTTPTKKQYLKILFSTWWFEVESNHRHEDFQSSALPTELSNHIKLLSTIYKKMATWNGLEPSTSSVTG